MKKTLFDYIVTVVIMLVSFPILLFLGLITSVLLIIFPKKSHLSIFAFCAATSVLFGIWIKYKGPFPKKGEYIFLFNHSSFIDYFLSVLAMGYKRKWVIVYGKNLEKYPIFKFFLRRIGIGVDRSSQKSKVEASDKIRKALNDGFSLALFPEGTRMRSYQMAEILLPFKNGAFSNAIELGKDIIPTIFSRPILYSRPDKPIPFSPRVITITYGNPISVEGKSRVELRDETHFIMKKMLLNTP